MSALAARAGEPADGRALRARRVVLEPKVSSLRRVAFRRCGQRWPVEVRYGPVVLVRASRGARRAAVGRSLAQLWEIRWIAPDESVCS